jgi:hypothetical protein
MDVSIHRTMVTHAAAAGESRRIGGAANPTATRVNRCSTEKGLGRNRSGSIVIPWVAKWLMAWLDMKRTRSSFFRGAIGQRVAILE